MRFDAMRHAVFATGILLAGLGGIAHSGVAQERVQAPAATSAATPVAQGETDPFIRYTSPGQCEEAARRLRDQYWRDKRRDTVVYAPETDSVPASVLRAARQCAARFSVATVASRELLDLAYLYLWTQQDDLALAALRRLQQVNVNRSASDRSWSLYLYVKGLLTAVPGRLGAAQASLKQLDAAGAPAATWRLFAHDLYASYAVSLNDMATAESEARAAIAASRQMSSADRIDWIDFLQSAYFTLTTPVALTRGGAPALAMLDTALTELTPLRPAGSGDQRGIRDDIARRRIPLAALGAHGIPPVHATAWYGTNGDTLRPRRGVPTLLMFTGTACDGGCYPTFATLRRLHATYGDRLDIVFMASTRGYFRDQIMPSPATEADSAGSYYTKFLHLPIALAVESTSFQFAPDGRRQNATMVNAHNYAFGRPAILLDSLGTVRWVGQIEPDEERVWNRVIHSILP